MTAAHVYWIHLPEQTDLLTQGYIGVTTKGVETRYKAHLKAASTRRRSFVLHAAIRKYGIMQVDTLVKGLEDYCYELEERLRPEPKIGWNLAKGGGKSPSSGRTGPDSPLFGSICSEETKRKISEANSGIKNGMATKTGFLNHFYGKRHSEESLVKMRRQVISEAHRKINSDRLKNLKPWEHPKAIRSVWTLANEYWEIFSVHSPKNTYQFSKLTDVTPQRLIKMLKMFNDGWNPSTDASWCLFRQTQGGVYGT